MSWPLSTTLNPLLNPLWSVPLALRLPFTRKIKVGFGPITTGENDLAERKWRIDPIINALNQQNDRYFASYFLSPEQMADFDLVVIVKKFNPAFIAPLAKLKEQGKVFIYDIVDNPNRGPQNPIYFADCLPFSLQMDAFILSSPLHEADVKKFSKPFRLIEHPIINTHFKKDYTRKDCIQILAQGYYEGLVQLKVLEPLIAQVSEELNLPVKLIYHSEVVFEERRAAKAVKWSVDNAFQIMQEVDFAITAKELSKPHQRTKPSTKVIAYLAAGLPVICTPTESDRLVIKENVTGLYAFTTEDWLKHLRYLCTNPQSAEQMGRAGRASVIDQYSIPQITEKYVELFDLLIAERKK